MDHSDSSHFPARIISIASRSASLSGCSDAAACWIGSHETQIRTMHRNSELTMIDGTPPNACAQWPGAWAQLLPSAKAVNTRWVHCSALLGCLAIRKPFRELRSNVRGKLKRSFCYSWLILRRSDSAQCAREEACVPFARRCFGDK